MLIIGKMLLRGRAVPQGLPRGEYLVQDPASHIGESIPTHTCSSCAPLLPHPSPPTYLAHRLEVVALAHHLVLLGQAVLAECIAVGREEGGGCVERGVWASGVQGAHGAECVHMSGGRGGCRGQSRGRSRTLPHPRVRFSIALCPAQKAHHAGREEQHTAPPPAHRHASQLKGLPHPPLPPHRPTPAPYSRACLAAKQ